MKYVLVDNRDNVVNTVELGSNVGISGARTYFLGVKRIDEKSFDKLWKVMSQRGYDEKFKSHTRKPSSERIDYPSYIRWWEEEKLITDEELE